MHHLGRHSVACFLTRGQGYISWERGAEVFDELLLDWDPAANSQCFSSLFLQIKIALNGPWYRWKLDVALLVKKINKRIPHFNYLESIFSFLFILVLPSIRCTTGFIPRSRSLRNGIRPVNSSGGTVQN